MTTTTFTLTATLEQPFDEALAATRAALSDQGFGIITEIDLAGTLKEKIGVEVPPQIILGACRPHLAHEAIQSDPAIAAMLPCNVVVRTVDATTTVVEAFDPDVMTQISGNETLKGVARDARERLTAALDALGAQTYETQEN